MGPKTRFSVCPDDTYSLFFFFKNILWVSSVQSIKMFIVFCFPFPRIRDTNETYCVWNTVWLASNGYNSNARSIQTNTIGFWTETKEFEHWPTRGKRKKKKRWKIYTSRAILQGEEENRFIQTRVFRANWFCETNDFSDPCVVKLIGRSVRSSKTRKHKNAPWKTLVRRQRDNVAPSGLLGTTVVTRAIIW